MKLLMAASPREQVCCSIKPRIFSVLLQECKVITQCYKHCYGELMAKAHVGHHLLRVRIRKRIFRHLQEVADYESDRTGEHVTVSDLVRQACVNLLVLHETMRSLHELPDLMNPDLDDEDWEDLFDGAEKDDAEEEADLDEELASFQPFTVAPQRLN